jgi:hypothetical protein
LDESLIAAVEKDRATVGHNPLAIGQHLPKVTLGRSSIEFPVVPLSPTLHETSDGLDIVCQLPFLL